MREAGVAAGSSGGGARPRSGVWALLTRLRRGASSDSLSSTGSDATVSFAFLSPPPPNDLHSSQDPTPLTDSYKKRVRDRNVRRQNDRDLTLHRKYGLIRGDATFDAFSLPHVRRSFVETSPSEEGRERRAASESLPRCTAHVPGKRRAPPPPTHALTAAHTSSLGRRHSRKRPAPPPPAKPLDITKDKAKDTEKENIDINTLVKMRSNKSDRGTRPISNDVTNFFKTDNSSKKDGNAKVPKMKREKSFLQQIFEGKKRNSAIEPGPERILPSISELDKQAAEIIETFRLQPLARSNRGNAAAAQGDTWFCTRCLRKYNATVVTCLYCLPGPNYLGNGLVTEHFRNNTNTTNIYTQIDNNSQCGASSSHGNGVAMDEREKLKEMLKEIKDSLPKKSKPVNKTEPQSETEINKAISQAKSVSNQTGEVGRRDRHDKESKQQETDSNRDSYYDPVTLRIGSIASNEDRGPVPSTSKQIVSSSSSKAPVCRVVNVKTEPVTETAVVTQPLVLVAPQPTNHEDISKKASENGPKNPEAEATSSTAISNGTKSQKLTQGESFGGPKKENDPIREPLTLTSLLNPIYIPQQATALDRRRLFFSQAATSNSGSKTGSKAPTVSNDKLPSSSVSKQPTTSLSESQQIRSSSELKLLKEGQSRTANIRLVKEMSPAPPKQKNPLQNQKSNAPPSQKPPSTFTSVSTSTSNTPLPENSKLNNANFVKMSVDQHSKRREWVNQLEQSIAQGDEIAAAQAAAKLAQLRVACSVLSFSSQIVSESSKDAAQVNQPKPSTSASNETRAGQQLETNRPKSKVNAAVQSVEVVTSKGNFNKCVPDPGPGGINHQETKHSGPGTKPEMTASRPNALEENSNEAPSTSAQHANGNGSDLVEITVWVEDRLSTRGPLRLRVRRRADVRELRARAQSALGVPARLQRWVVGRALCNDDTAPLALVAGPHLDKPFYLCLVEDTNAGTEFSETETKLQTHQEITDVYSKLVHLEQCALVANSEPFECGVCTEQCPAGGGAVLRECIHAFCRECLADVVRHSTDATIACPATNCLGTLQEREIRSLVSPEQFELWLARGLAAAESGSRNAFHCRTPDCRGWALCDAGVRVFVCPVCNCHNCVPCKAIHEGVTCEEHRARQQMPSSSSCGDDQGTRALLDELIAKGEAIECPECSAIITKKWGCDWVKCSACKTEICWVTRGRRWGPAGRGDTSAGCRCGVDGQRCHPNCGYCH